MTLRELKEKIDKMVETAGNMNVLVEHADSNKLFEIELDSVFVWKDIVIIGILDCNELE